LLYPFFMVLSIIFRKFDFLLGRLFYLDPRLDFTWGRRMLPSRMGWGLPLRNTSF